MTVSILRTADAWWVRTPTGAARVTTTATTTRQLLGLRKFSLERIRLYEQQVGVRL